MPLINIDPRFLDRVWPQVSGMLSAAVVHASDDVTLDQLQYQIRRGECLLLVWADEELQHIEGVATLLFKDHPKQRIAFISFLGGEMGLTDPEKFSVLKEWCLERGASAIEAWCHPGSARLFQRFGFDQKYIVTRCAI